MKSLDKKEVFSSVSVSKALFTMAGPTIISQLINLFYNMVDTFYLGRTGNPNMVAAITVSYTVFMLTISFSNLFGIGGGSQIARLFGQEQQEDAKNVCVFSIYGSFAIALLYSLTVGLLMNPILFALGASENTIEYARQYVLLVIVIGNIPLIVSSTMAHLIRNVGLSTQASIGLSAGGILNMMLDPLFMFVLFPKGMEVFGAALATLLSNIAAFVYFIIILQKASKSSPVSMDIRKLAKVKAADVKNVFMVGIPSALLTTFVDVANIFTNRLASLHGDIQLAAIGIVMKIERLPVAINIGISQGMLPIVAYNYSSGNHVRMKETISLARKYGLLISLACTIFFEILAEPIVRIFLSTKSDFATQALETITFASVFLRLRAPASIFKLLNFHTSYCLQAMGDGKSTLFHAFAREMVFHIPFMYLLNHFFGVNGLVIAIVFGELFGAILALFLLRKSLRTLSVS